VHTIPESGCSLLNTTCQCSSSDLVSITSDCMRANCTLTERLGRLWLLHSSTEISLTVRRTGQDTSSYMRASIWISGQGNKKHNYRRCHYNLHCSSATIYLAVFLGSEDWLRWLVHSRRSCTSSLFYKLMPSPNFPGFSARISSSPPSVLNVSIAPNLQLLG
jgi:hypothetical protein